MATCNHVRVEGPGNIYHCKHEAGHSGRHAYGIKRARPSRVRIGTEGISQASERREDEDRKAREVAIREVVLATWPGITIVSAGGGSARFTFPGGTHPATWFRQMPRDLMIASVDVDAWRAFAGKVAP